MQPNSPLALVYLRRSTEKQCESLRSQLDWAIAEAKKRDIPLEVKPDDLEYMLANNLSEYGNLYIDNGVSGADLDRSGFQKMRKRTETEPTITHVFIMRRDRLARPEIAAEMVLYEQQISRRGISLVLVDEVVPPLDRGSRDFGRDVQALYAYHESGKYLETLAERTIDGQRRNALQGYSAGGSPPYGHNRVLVNRVGEIIEVLDKGKVVRQQEHFVRWLPGMTEKTKGEFKVWLLILQLYTDKWGLGRIANHLNAMGIPSPGAGKSFSRSGVKRYCSGKWTKKSVQSLITNPIILGVKQFAAFSTGRFRRAAVQGFRNLTDADLNDANQPKPIRNDPTVVISAPSGAESSVDADQWRGLQSQLKTRGKNQRGLSRARDVSANPLSGRLFDRSPCCGEPMYFMSRYGKPVYTCSRYSRSNGLECHRNAISADALLKFISQELVARTVAQLSPAEIRERLHVMASAKAAPAEMPADLERAALERQRDQLSAELETMTSNLSLASNRVVFEAIESKYLEAHAQREEISQKLASLPPIAEGPPASVEERVAAAMQLLGDIGSVSTTPEGRLALSRVVDLLNCRIGLSFQQTPQGPKRTVSRLIGGVVTFGDNDFPKTLASPSDQPDNHPSPNHGPGACGHSNPAVPNSPAETLCSIEAESFTKGKDVYPAPTAGQAGQWHSKIRLRQTISLFPPAYRNDVRNAKFFLLVVAG